MYNAEREETVFNQSNNMYRTCWTNVSKCYGYATKGGDKTDRNTCLATLNWNGLGDCYNNDWLSYSNLWTLTLGSSALYDVFFVSASGKVDIYSGGAVYYVHPVVYFIPDIVIQDGTRAMNDPFILFV